MNKDTKDLLFLGAVGVGAYFLFTKLTSATNSAVGDFSYASPTQTIRSVTPAGDVVEETINTPEEGVNAINRAVSQGRYLISSGKTLIKPWTNPDGSKTGVARLADGSVKALTVSTVKRDSSGLSEWDRRIIKNIQEARARGENPLVPNDLKPFVGDF